MKESITFDIVETPSGISRGARPYVQIVEALEKLPQGQSLRFDDKAMKYHHITQLKSIVKDLKVKGTIKSLRGLDTETQQRKVWVWLNKSIPTK